jgi:hypothetical protein
MRGFRSTLVLLAVLVGLMGYIYFVEWKKPAGTEGEEAKPKVFAVAADTIAELSVRSGNEPATVLKKNGSEWEIIQPVQTAADDSEVSGVTSSLASLEIQRVVEENPGNLATYGLASPHVDIGFKAEGDKDYRHLLLGDKTPTGGDMYARLPDAKRVFLVPAYVDSSFNRTTFDLRDKSVLKFDREKVDGVEVSTPKGVIDMAKNGEDWMLQEPLKARADYGTVEGLIGRVQSARMKSIVASEPKDLKEYGLDKPELVATLASGSARASLEIGKKTDDGSLYAKDASRPMVFTVESSLADDLGKTADDYRRKDVFEFRPYNASRIEIARGKETLVFEKVKSGTGKDATEKWRQVSPTARDVDETKMDGFLTKLSNLRAQSFVDSAVARASDEAPVLSATARYDDGKKQESVVFTKNGADTLASRAGEPGAAKIDQTEFDDAIKALDALK